MNFVFQRLFQIAIGTTFAVNCYRPVFIRVQCRSIFTINRSVPIMFIVLGVSEQI